ncbi:hypothetical protein GGS20DRAFT_559035 [Poronia punctata]|nr:hypothetical protein GGS20DRAFT_559035 [Poronia punctata]
MDSWPQEVYDKIGSFLDHAVGEAPFALPAIATVSTRFQHAVERRTFRNICKSISLSELETFEQIMTPRRGQNLRRLEVIVVLPSYPKDESGLFETDKDRRANDAAATEIIRRLFKCIRSFDDEKALDHERRPLLELDITGPLSLPDQRNPYVLRSRFSFLNLISDGEDFPTVPRVVKFSIDNNGLGRHWSPAVAPLLTSKLTNVKTVEWSLDNSEKDWGLYYSLDKIYRDDLVRGIRSTKLPKSVQDFRCVVASPTLMSPQQVLPKFTEAGIDDPVGLALRELTKNCRKVELGGFLAKSTFETSRNTQDADVESCWQNTTHLRIMLPKYGCSPDGTYLFDVGDVDQDADDYEEEVRAALNHLPPGYSVTEEEREAAEEFFDDHLDFLLGEEDDEVDGPMRNIPNNQKMNATLTAFAHRCSLMPALEEAVLEVFYDSEEEWPFQVWCFAPHTLGHFNWDKNFKAGIDSWRVYFHVDEWRPTAATLDAFVAIPGKRDGGESIISFLPWGDYA